MIKIHGFCHGQYGDLFINTVPARSIKDNYPDAYIIQPINIKFESVAPLFAENKYIDEIYFTENYDNWPSEKDRQYLIDQKFDAIFSAMPGHRNGEWANWWQLRHQAAEACYRDYIPIPNDLSVKLTKWFDVDRNHKTVCITPFGGNEDCEKRLTTEGAQKVVNFLNKLGYDVIHIAISSDPNLDNAIRYESNYFNAVKMILSSDALISVDTGFTWCLSGYNHPVFASYFTSGVVKKVENIQPINPNGQYVTFENRDSIAWDYYFIKLGNFLNNI